MKWVFSMFCAIVALLTCALYLLTISPTTQNIQYGVTFSTLYAEEIGLSWRDAYIAALDDLGVRHFRIPVYWDRVEKTSGTYDWSEVDFQVEEAKKRHADIILAIGRRVPRWPECHVPSWAKQESWESQKDGIRELLRHTIERYKRYSNVVMWQVENEPFLKYFADGSCGALDEAFLYEEIELVHSLDGRPVMTTDGGNFGTWVGAYRAGDVFGTSMYLYFWRPDTGLFRTILPPAYYRAKTHLIELLFGTKQVLLSELSLEPWLGADIRDVPIDEQLTRMNLNTIDEILTYARQTPFDMHYLWGVEWWYYMKEHGYPEFWDYAKTLYANGI